MDFFTKKSIPHVAAYCVKVTSSNAGKKGRFGKGKDARYPQNRVCDAPPSSPEINARAGNAAGPATTGGARANPTPQRAPPGRGPRLRATPKAGGAGRNPHGGCERRGSDDACREPRQTARGGAENGENAQRAVCRWNGPLTENGVSPSSPGAWGVDPPRAFVRQDERDSTSHLRSDGRQIMM